MSKRHILWVGTENPILGNVRRSLANVRHAGQFSLEHRIHDCFHTNCGQQASEYCQKRDGRDWMCTVLCSKHAEQIADLRVSSHDLWEWYDEQQRRKRPRH